ncbi:MAG: RecX family transcriptional regulator [Bacillales bacterium]|nr:RecX family transcriptional regulator [Bacillales bacterium]
MHLEKTGKVIRLIKFNKSSIVICFDNDEKIKISESTFSHFYLYKGKLLDNNEIKNILDYESLVNARTYAINLLSKSLYSEKKIKDKLLIKKKLKNEDINVILADLKRLNLIDDNEYLNSFLELNEAKNYGKLRIIKGLRDDGIDEKLINQIIFDDDNEFDKAKIILSKYIKCNPTKNYQKLCQSGYTHLLQYGFTSDISSRVIELIKDEYDFDKEDILLDKEIRKYLNKPSFNINDYEQKRKIINSLFRKGFNYDKIEKKIRRILEDEVC